MFISYARRDGVPVAQRLRDSLASEGIGAWLDTERIVGGAVWTSDIERAIDEAEVVVAVLTPGSYTSEICRAEQLRSLRKGKYVIPVLGAACDVPLHLETKNYRDLSRDSEFKLLIEDIRSRTGGVVLSEQFRTTYVTAPPLPRNYLERPEDLASLRNALITEDSGRSIALTALRGMAGIGKTILAQALCHDEVVQEAFPDGVIWVTTGKESAYDLKTRMQEVRRGLGDQPSSDETELNCINRYRTLMRDKAALVVVDDVWSARDVEPFRAESLRSRLLFTTRDASIGAALGAEEHTAGLPTYQQSWDLLARSSGRQPENLLPEAGDLILECGRLPLAISMIGAMLRGKPQALWTHALSLLRREQATLFRAIQVSVDALEPAMRERYLALRVMLEDMAVHPAIQQVLWATDEFEALVTAEHFVSLSLAQREGEDGSIRLHDLQLDYVRAQYPDRDSLALIHGAVRLSSNVIRKDPWQFSSQMVGRLIPHAEQAGVRSFSDLLACATREPWLRPLQSALCPPGTALLRTLEGHSRGVSYVALTSDGRRAVSASYDNTLKVWDLDTGREVHTLVGHSDSVTSVAVSTEASLVISGSIDGTLKVWDLDTGSQLCTHEKHSDWVDGVAMSADGRRAVSASRDKTLKLWDLDSGRELLTIEGYSGFLTGVAMSADGRRAVSASDDHTVRVWDLVDGRELCIFEGHSDPITCIALSADGLRAISASRDNTLKVWDSDSGREIRMLQGHSDWVYSVAISSDRRRVVSGSRDKTLKVWDFDSGYELRTLEGHFEGVTSTAISADGRRVVSASDDNTLRVWDVDAGRELLNSNSHAGHVNDLAVSADGRRAVSASDDKTLKVWDLETTRELRALKGHCGFVTGVAMSAQGRWAVSASVDGTLKVWDLDSGCELRTLEEHSLPLIGVAVSTDGHRAVSASNESTLKVWDLDTCRELRTLRGRPEHVNGVAVSADGRRAVSASRDHTLKVWDLDTGREVRVLAGHSDCVISVAMRADGRRAVSASQDKTVRVWDLESGYELRAFKDHAGWVNSVAVSTDGRRAVSASEDKTVKLWDLDTGHRLATFTCDSWALCCAFATNELIVAGDAAGRVHFLKLENS